MRKYLRMRFLQKSEAELSEFENGVASIIDNLSRCRSIDLDKFSYRTRHSNKHNARARATEVHRAFAVAAGIRNRKRIALSPRPMYDEQRRKRRRIDAAVSLPLLNHKIAKVTPIRTPQVWNS